MRNVHDKAASSDGYFGAVSRPSIQDGLKDMPNTSSKPYKDISNVLIGLLDEIRWSREIEIRSPELVEQAD